MRKLFLLLITLTTFNNVSFASFPIHGNIEADTLQTKEIKQYHYNLKRMGVDLNSCQCESCRNEIAPIVSKLMSLSKKKDEEIQKEKPKPKLNGNLFVFLSVLFALSTIVFTFLTIGSGMMHNGNPFPYLILTLVSIGASILSGIIAKERGAKTGKAFLGLGVLGLGVLLFMLLLGG